MYMIVYACMRCVSVCDCALVFVYTRIYHTHTLHPQISRTCDNMLLPSAKSQPSTCTTSAVRIPIHHFSQWLGMLTTGAILLPVLSSQLFNFHSVLA